jgi:hypothetical protein
MSDQSNYKVKYLKYKNKYLSLKTQIGFGSFEPPLKNPANFKEGTIMIGEDEKYYIVNYTEQDGFEWDLYNLFWPPFNIHLLIVGDIKQGQNGKYYEVKEENGKKTWFEYNTILPIYNINSTSVGDIKKGQDGKYYEVKEENGKKTWVKYSTTLPPVNINNVQVGDIKKGQDGKNYKVQIKDRIKKWVLHNLEFKINY